LFEFHERQGALNQWRILFKFLIVLADSINVFFKVNNLGFMSEVTNDTECFLNDKKLTGSLALTLHSIFVHNNCIPNLVTHLLYVGSAWHTLRVPVGRVCKMQCGVHVGLRPPFPSLF
jgi:hypothetical protein